MVLVCSRHLILNATWKSVPCLFLPQVLVEHLLDPGPAVGTGIAKRKQGRLGRLFSGGSPSRGGVRKEASEQFPMVIRAAGHATGAPCVRMLGRLVTSYSL